MKGRWGVCSARAVGDVSSWRVDKIIQRGSQSGRCTGSLGPRRTVGCLWRAPARLHVLKVEHAARGPKARPKAR